MKSFGRSRCFRRLTGLALACVILVLSSSVVSAGSPSGRSHLKYWDESQGPAQAGIDSEVLELIKNDHIELYRKALRDYGKDISDYSGTFTKQERIRGKLRKREVIQFKLKEDPFSIYMEWEKNPGAADKLLYVEGENDGKMIVHPTALFGLVKSVKRDPTGKDAMKDCLYPCTMFGFERMMSSSLSIYEMAAAQGDLETEFIGITEFDGRKSFAIEARLPKKSCYELAKVVVQIDAQWLVPSDIMSFNWDDELISRYSFSDLVFNTGLSDAEFTAQNNGL